MPHAATPDKNWRAPSVIFRCQTATPTEGRNLAFPRHETCPGDAATSCPPRSEGTGNAGCWPHPRALRAKKTALCARKQQQGSQINRHSLRDGLRLIRGLLGVPGLLASVASRSSSARLDASVGASGPHDFARPQAMLSSARQAALSTLASIASRCQRP